MNILVDRAAHTYHVDGIAKPSVTDIISYNGLISDFCKDAFAAEKGTAIHHAGALLFQGILDWYSLDPRILPYIQSLDAFIKQTGFEAMTVEYSGYNEKVGYCGTLDVWGKFPDGRDMVIDLKSGGAQKAHRPQLSAYQAMIGASHRAALYLQDDGSLAKLVEFTDKNDWKAFFACAQIYHKETQTQRELEPHRENLKAWLEGK